MKLPKFSALILATALALSTAACGKPTVEGSDSRYKSNKDKISVLITKNPANKSELEKKLAEFEKEYSDAMAAGSDEDKIKKLGTLNSRMDKYIAELEKTNAPTQGGAGAPSNKLDGAQPAQPGQPAQPAAGGKLDGGTAPAGGNGMGGGTAPAGGSGMGGGTAPAGGSGMGGGSAAPPPAQPSGGMGGM